MIMVPFLSMVAITMMPMPNDDIDDGADVDVSGTDSSDSSNDNGGNCNERGASTGADVVGSSFFWSNSVDDNKSFDNNDNSKFFHSSGPFDGDSNN